MPDRPVLRVGKLTVVGDRFSFETMGAAFDAKPGEEVEVALLYDYEEASKEREGMRFVFTVDFDGTMANDEATVEDRPMLHDRQYGTLGRRVRAPASGVRLGRFRIEAFYTRGPWFSHEQEKTAHFQTEGRFLVTVKK